MKKVLVAGSTGYLGQYMLKELKKQGYWVRALARNPKKLEHVQESIDEVFVDEVTQPESLDGVCDGIDVVFTSVGITRQKDRVTYMDVDYQGNLNLLEQACKSGVQKFIYVSVVNGHLMKDLKMVHAKELFVDRLKETHIDYTVIRPTGFFSDMLEFLNMAKKGKIYLFGKGEHTINPIHGNDLAEVCVNAIERAQKEIDVGGPTIYTWREIAELAFRVVNKQANISTIPLWVKNVMLPLMRMCTPVKTYGPLEFMLTVFTMDVIGTSYGREELGSFFEQHVHR
ncbi:MAG: SDR family oxidoreductase [bacterium]|nr:SDR family oxidoreductase [bacterium]